jgi:hypothetical protein
MGKVSRKAAGIETLKMKHVTNSLGQIESWVAAVRTALATLSPNTPLRMPSTRTSAFVGAIKVQSDCPPPTRKRRRKASKKKN